MNEPSNVVRRIAVIGGGITGLSAAHRLTELDGSLEVCLFEASGRLGGVLETVRKNDLLIERGSDSFITNVPWAIDLCRRVGLMDQMIETQEAHRKAFVVFRGRLCHVPDGFLLMAPSKIWPMLTTPLLSLRGKIRLAWEYFVPRRRAEGDETMASFVKRRLGQETYERIVQPLIGGIYTADPEKLSLAATMPQFIEMEREHGSLIRGAKRRAKAKGNTDQKSSGARYSLFMAPSEGMTSLVEAIASRLPESSVRFNSPVRRLQRREDHGWNVSIGGVPDPETFDAVIVAAPAPKAAELLAEVDPGLARDLGSIQYAGSAVVSVCYRRDQIDHALDGFGFVVPAIENRRILAGSFSSNKFAGRAPKGHTLIRVFVGGATQAELIDLPDDQLRTLVHEELTDLLGIHGEPMICEISRWGEKLPQYHVGHVDLVKRIEQRAGELPNFQLAGNAYHGVGVPHCIHSGEQAAENILKAVS